MLLRRPWILGFCACSVFPEQAVLPGGSAGASGDQNSEAGRGGAPPGGQGGSSGVGPGGSAEAGAGGLLGGGSGGATEAGAADAGAPTGGIAWGGGSGTTADAGAPMGGGAWMDGGTGGVAAGGCAGAVAHELLPDGDAWITEAEPKGNFGAELDLQIGTGIAEEARILVRFDLSDVPAAARVGRATLELELRSSVGEDRDIAAYALEQTWIERQVTWIVARAGANWVPPGARPSHGPSDTLSIGLGTAAGTRVVWDLGADVQNALDAQASAVTWLLMEQETDLPRIVFASRDLAARAPRLLIETCSP